MKEFLCILGRYVKKKWWYLVLLILSTIYVWNYRYEIFQLSDLNVAVVIFLLWLVLLIMPLFSEVEFFGIKLKKEVEQTRKEVKETLQDIKMQLLDIKVSNTNTNTVTFGALPSKEEIDAMKKAVEENADGSVLETTVDESAQGLFDDNMSQAVFLFKVRFEIEKSLKAICEKANNYINGYETSIKMLKSLISADLIDGRTGKLIQEIISITNRGIHGEIISDEYIQFIKAVFPDVKAKLKDAEENSTPKYYFTCSRCGFSGKSAFQNECPKCGLVSCDE